MKKKVLCSMVCMSVLFSNITVFAETEIVIESQFENGASFESDRVAVSFKDSPENYAYINKSGEVVLPVGTVTTSQEPASFSDDMLVISTEKVDESSGYISFYTEIYDKNGIIVRRDESIDELGTTLKVSKYHDGYALAGKYTFEGLIKNVYAVGYVDKQGNLVFDDKYEYATTFNDGYAIVGNTDANTHKDYFEILDTNGSKVPVSEDIKPFSVRDYDKNSREVFSEGLKEVYNKDGLFGFIDTMGNLVIPCTMPYEPENFSEGLSRVFDGEKYGYINTENELVIPYQYEVAGNFHDGRALVQDKNNFDERYYIDIYGNKVFDELFYEKYDFNSRYTKDGDLTHENYLEGDNHNSEIIAYPSLGDFNGGLVAVKDKETGLYGYVNTNGEEVIPCEFEYVGPFNEGLAWVEKDGGIGYIKSPYVTSLRIDNKHVMTDTDPLNKDGKIMVPIEEVSKYFGMETNVDFVSNVIEIKKDDIYIKNNIGETALETNSDITELSTHIIIEDGKAYVYVRDLADIFGYEINWEKDTSTIDLKQSSL